MPAGSIHRPSWSGFLSGSPGLLFVVYILLACPWQLSSQEISSSILSATASISSITATVVVRPESTATADNLMDAPVPIIYGEAGFRQRIEARTGGNREALGLVLSGGSARAFAHIGVLSRLEESGIVPDFIVANSMGSIIGLLYAAGLSPAQIRHLVTETELGSLFTPVFPLKGGLLDVSRFSGLIRAYLGELKVEDLPIPILICSEDLVTKREIRLAQGDFYQVMEASFALPVYFSPVPYEGHLLIDGGITNLVPLGVAYNYSDRILVSSTFYDAPSQNLQNPLVILNTAIDIGKRRAGVADLIANSGAVWIRCDVESYSFMAFDSIAVLADAGYRSADAIAGLFATLPAAGLDPILRARRDSFDQRIPVVLRNWARFERTPVDKPSLGLGFNLESFAYPGDRWFLRDSIAMGASLGLRAGSFEALTSFGGDWEAYGKGEQADPGPRTLAPVLSVALDFYPLPALELEAYGAMRGEGEADLSWYTRNGFHAAFPGSPGGIRMDLRSYLEHRLDTDFGLESMLLTSSVELSPASTAPGLSGSIEGGHQLDGDFTRNMGFARFSTELPLAGSLSLVAGGLVRAGLSAGTKVPLFLSDGFGSLDSSRYSRLDRVLALGSLAVQWSPAGFRPSLGELLLLKHNNLSLFSDFLWRSGGGKDLPLVAGVRLGSEISLIGLESSRIQGELGYDFDAGSFVLRAFLF